MPFVRPSKLTDIASIVPTVRDADAEEIAANSGCSVAAALMLGMQYSDNPLSTVDEDGQVLAMFGVVSHRDNPRIGSIWMITSVHLERYKVKFIRESRRWVNALQAHYDLLYNVVDERNTLHVRWIEHCGFIFLKRHPEYGAGKVPFIEFVRI